MKYSRIHAHANTSVHTESAITSNNMFRINCQLMKHPYAQAYSYEKEHYIIAYRTNYIIRIINNLQGLYFVQKMTYSIPVRNARQQNSV